jgi:DNA-binding NarL/FixJ family response regulator
MPGAHPIPRSRFTPAASRNMYATSSFALPPMLPDPMSDRPATDRTPARVLIADDHAPTRSGVRQSLEAGGFSVCAEAADGEEAIKLARKERPDVCLLDISMPGGGGIKAATVISEEMPETAIVMLTAFAGDDELFDSLKAGAAGYLLKETDPNRLPFALRGILDGEAAVPRRLVARLIDEFRSQGRRRRVPIGGKRGPELTTRQWEVLELMGEGYTTTEIGRRLDVSPTTVRRHVSDILAKLGVSDRREAIALFSDEPH